MSVFLYRYIRFIFIYHQALIEVQGPNYCTSVNTSAKFAFCFLFQMYPTFIFCCDVIQIYEPNVFMCEPWHFNKDNIDSVFCVRFLTQNSVLLMVLRCISHLGAVQLYFPFNILFFLFFFQECVKCRDDVLTFKITSV